ncbi:hypothetical protein SAMN02745126_00959 [Enhydrobacter aerosaccus]|uniref:SpoIIAA-like n=1 Tax=Enhydrobacter aerosaccus TaxID=225324 RepID=A0A1T4KGS4_9HYPH|nr:hypothetical protein [Enhydrobacter aerosaccus]SJZ41557.1 hypothetical protein SAMN02745126_00959 [Enhydrobacter aerosaccus]
MPLHIDIDHDQRLVRTTASGLIFLKDVLDYLDTVATRDVMAYAKLFDATRAEFSLSDDDMMVLGARVSAYAEMDPRGPIALIVASDTAEDLGRRYANLGGAARPLKIFRKIDDGWKWLQAEAKS